MTKRAFTLTLAAFLLVIFIMINFVFPKNKPVSSPQAPSPVPAETTFTLIAAGDILMHNTMIDSGKQPDGTYRYTHFFPEIKGLLQEGDYAYTNLETAMAGPATKGYTGYPEFNSPDETAQAIKEAGFDLVVTANNHLMDSGQAGALRTLDVLKKAGLDTVGTQREKGSYLIREFNGIKVGFLAYTYGSNVPGQAGFLQVLNRDKVLGEMRELRPQVDLLLLIVHWGTEYSAKPTADQQKLAREFLAAGADGLIGSHPHVLQPMEMVGSGAEAKPIFYAIGNLIGDQRGVDRNSGIVAKLTWKKEQPSGKMILEQASYTPTYSHRYQKNGKLMLRVVPVEKTLEALRGGRETILTSKDAPTLEQVLRDTRRIVGPGYQRAGGTPK